MSMKHMHRRSVLLDAPKISLTCMCHRNYLSSCILVVLLFLPFLLYYDMLYIVIRPLCTKTKLNTYFGTDEKYLLWETVMLEGTKATEGNKFFFEYLMHLYILSLSLNPQTDLIQSCANWSMCVIVNYTFLF